MFVFGYKEERFYLVLSCIVVFVIFICIDRLIDG